jgi:putative flavoprotein involved in K+ transport
MAEACLPASHPRNWAIDGEATEADGVTDAWLTFETDVVRGIGHVRLKGDKAWTLLTTAQEIKGHEEPKGTRRVKGVEHGARQGPREPGRGACPRDGRAWLQDPALHRHHRRRPGRHRARRPPAPPRRAHDHRREERTRGRQLAQALQVALPARPRVVRPPALPALPRPLAGVQPEGQDRRLARDVHEGHGPELLDEIHLPLRPLRRGDRRNGPSSVHRDGEEVVLRPKQLVLATGMSGVPNIPELPGARQVQGRGPAFQPAPRPGRLCRQEGGGRGVEQLGRTTSAPRCGKPMPTSPWCSGLPRMW